MLKELVLEYCNESSIHGMRYLTDKRKTLLERISWVFFLLFSIACCCWFTAQLYINAQQSSIVVTISNRPTKISDIIFPSLTICSLVPFNVSVLNMTAAMLMGNNYADYSIEELRSLWAQYCNLRDIITSNTSELDYVQTLIKTNLRLNSLRKCRYGVIAEECMNEFQEIITNQGVCYAYNLVNSDRLFRSHNGLTYDFSKNLTQTENTFTQPKNIAGPFERGRIDLSFKIPTDNMQQVCKADSNGFIVALRSPYDIVVINSADVRVKEDFSTDIALTPSILESNEELKSFTVKERECYFENERSLYFLRYYTQENCHFECLTNLTLSNCGCVMYFMPRLKTTLICLHSDLQDCARDMEQTYDNMGIGPCRCYALCNSVSFQVNVVAHKMDMDTFQTPQAGRFVQTRIGVFTKEKSIYPLQRSQLYGFNEYIANFGGLLGLFLGVSILSIIEIFYYVFVRSICLYLKKEDKDIIPVKDIKRDKKQHRFKRNPWNERKIAFQPEKFPNESVSVWKTKSLFT